MSFEDLFVQVFQPYFYYSIIALTISFVCIKIVVKCCPFIGSKTKSLIYLIPLAAPLFVMFSFPPKTVIQAISYHLIGSFNMPVPQGLAFLNPFRFQPSLAQTMVTVVGYSTNSILSITGIICLAGLAIGGIYAVTTISMGNWLASKLLNVINLDSNEYGWLQKEVAEISKKLSISSPQVALVEDLRPNAFILGNGRRAKLVFTVGILNVLNKEELLAVASHELAHVKNHDFLFKTISNSLTVISFFNPLAYFAFFNSQREREMLADENGAKLLQKPESLAIALTKITKALQNLPGENKLISLTSNLLISSPIIHRPQILSGHPKIDLRLSNIHKLTSAKPKRLKPSKLIVAVMLTCIIIVAGITTTYALVNLQSGYVTPKNVLAGGATYVKGLSTDSLGDHIILVSTNMTFNPTIEQIYSLQNPNLQVLSSTGQASLNQVSNSNQNHAEYANSQSSLVNSGTNPSNVTIVYALTSGNGTMLIIKY